MPLDVIFLGTSGATPTVERNPPAVMVKREGELILFDCGEGTQRQMMKCRTGMGVDRIFITHLHADHFLGLPGLIQTMSFQDRERPLEVIGPPGMEDLVRGMNAFGAGRPNFEIKVYELNNSDSFQYDEYSVTALEVDHGKKIKSLGYVLEEDERQGKFDREKAIELGVVPGPDFGRLQKGESIEVGEGIVTPDQVIGPPRRGRKIVFSGDTRPLAQIEEISNDADLLIHDGTFTSDEAERAKETKHTTAKDAAKIAKKAEVRMLALFHLSSRYSKNYRPILDEAKKYFERSIVPSDFTKLRIPYPEKNRDIEVNFDANQNNRK